MGGAKRMLEEAEARGWIGTDKAVCSQCVSDVALVNEVLAAKGNARCDYCGAVPTLPEASAPVDLILELIVEGLRYEHEDPVEQVLWSSADGGYQMASYDTRDLLEEHEVTESEELLLDLDRSILQDTWVQRDPYASSPADALRWGWDAFRKFVKHQRRYTFLVVDDSTAFGAGDIPMDRMPAALADAVEEAGQIRVLSAGTKWWRVRVHPAGEQYRLAAELGSPTDAIAKDNRMTAKGVGAFYGASTPAGAQAEVAGYADAKNEGTIGEFELLRDISIVDLTWADDVPSLFDAGQRHKRAPLSFMRDFVKDVAKIADPSDVQNLDYIPTQVVAEYFRYELTGEAGRVNGILWRSSKDPTVENCVIFAGNEEMANRETVSDLSTLVLNPASVRLLPAPLNGVTGAQKARGFCRFWPKRRREH